MKLEKLLKILDEYAPFETQEEWDNSGLCVGENSAEVSKVCLALDLSEGCVDYAVENGIDCMITHHPAIFEPLKNLDFSNRKSAMLRKLIKNDINLISYHTNYDRANHGVSESFPEALGIYDYEKLITAGEECGYGVIFEREIDMDGILKLFKGKIEGAVLWGEKGTYKRIAFIGGSGGSFIDAIKERKADLLISADIKYHDAEYALLNGISVLDIGHFDSEIFSMKSLQNRLIKDTDLQVLIYDKATVKRQLIKMD